MIKIEIRGLNLDNVKKISALKKEEKYFLDYRVKSYEIFKKLNDPDFGPKYTIDYDKIIYYKTIQDDMKNNWSDVNSNVQDEFKGLGVLESEKNLDGIGIQYESEVIYHNMLKELEEKNVIFTSIDEAIKKWGNNKPANVIIWTNETQEKNQWLIDLCSNNKDIIDFWFYCLPERDC